MAISLRVAVREFSDFENAFAEEIQLYRSVHPEIEIEAVPLDLHALHAAIFERNGLRNGTWDIGFVVTDWLAEAVQQDMLENLTPWLASTPVQDWPSGWASSIVEPLRFGGQFYSLPWHDGPECLIYRRDLFADEGERGVFQTRFGYALAPPDTWSQFEDVARFFTRPESEQYGTLIAAFPDGHNTLYDFALHVWSRGGELQGPDGLPQLSSPEAAAALDFYKKVVRDASLCYPGAELLDSTRSGDVFLSGKIAMMVNWFGFAARCDRPGSPLAGKVAIAPIPAAKGLDPVSLSVFWTLGIGKGSRYKAAAYDFLRFLLKPEIERGIVKHGTVGCRLSTWRDAEVQRSVPCYAEIESISLSAKRLPRSSFLPVFAEAVNGVVEQALKTDRATEEILREAQSVLNTRKPHFR